MKVNEIKVGERFRVDYGDIEGLAESIKRFGLISPIAVTPNGELLAGGRRFKAAQLAGLEEVPVRIIVELSERDKRLVELEENIQRKELSWKEEISLKAEIDRLLRVDNPQHTQKETALEYFGETPANFSRDLELARAIEVFPELKECDNKFQASRAYRKMKEDGQWLLRHAQQKVAPNQWKWAEEHYQIGDALKQLELLKPSSFHFIECDPPYGLSMDQVISDKATELELFTSNDYEFNRELLSKLFIVAADHSWLILWHAISKLSMIHEILTTTGWNFDAVPAIWLKNASTINMNPDLKLSPKYEVFTVARKGSPKLVAPRDNVFEFSRVVPKDRIRHAEKPPELYLEILSYFVQPGMRLLCPFLGSGNFLIACYEKNLTAFGWELEESLKPLFVERVKRTFT